MDSISLSKLIEQLEDPGEYTGKSIPEIVKKAIEILRELEPQLKSLELSKLFEESEVMELIGFDQSFISLYKTSEQPPRFFLNIWVDLEESLESWLWLEVTRETIIDYLENKIDLDTCYQRSSMIVEESIILNGPVNPPLSVLALEDIPHSWRPQPKAFLNMQNDPEILDILKRLKET